MNFGKQKARIQPVLDFKDQCAVCGEIGMGCHFDHDLAALNHGRGQVGDCCSGFVIIAERELHHAGLAIPTESMPDDPLQI